MALMTDDKLMIHRIKKGDDKALNLLYKTHYPMIVHLVKTNSGNENDAEDLYQDAMAIIYEKIVEGALDQLNCTLKTYIYSVCRNKWLYHLRGRGKFRETFVDGHEFLNLDPVEPEEEALPYNEAMQQALQSISEMCQQLLLAFYYEKLSMEVIADRLGYNRANTVKSKKNKCMNEIREKARAILLTLQ